MNSVHCAKWSRQQDLLLMQAIQKHGVQWGLIVKYIKNIRSMNSVVKRWHGKLKMTEEGKKLQTILDQRIKKGNLESQPIESDQQNDSQDIDDTNYKWKRAWTEDDDEKLRNLLVKDGIVQWKRLASIFDVQTKEIKIRWRLKAFKPIMQPSKIGGALKWSVAEDSILASCIKFNLSWADISPYLPSRTEYSIEARWRRIAKGVETEQPVIKNKHLFRKQVLIRIANKRKSNINYKKQDDESDKLDKEQNLMVQ